MEEVSLKTQKPDRTLQTHSSEQEQGKQRVRGVTPRVVVLCLGLAALLGYLCPIIDYKLMNTFLGGSHLPPGALAVLLVLIGVVNPLLRLASKAWTLTRDELLTCYICCGFSSLIPGHGAENFIIPNLITPFYFATRENRWLLWLQPYLKPWLTPALRGDGTFNTELVSGWYTGLPQGTSIPWGAWAVPLTVWMTVVFVSYGMMACLSVMLRRQWAENEALSFPLLKLPLAMTQSEESGTGGSLSRASSGAASFWRDKMMWAGLLLAFTLQLVRGLHLYFPDVPDIPTGVEMGPYLSEPPWNQIEGVYLNAFPMAVGVAYLLSRDVGFSIWFFVWFVKLQLIAAYFLGFAPSDLPSAGMAPGRAFTAFQIQGAYWAYTALVMWTGREHFKRILARAVGRQAPDEGERAEFLPYPIAFWGFVGCFGALVGFACVAGVRLDIALALWMTYVVFAIALSRVAVEGGMLLLLHDSAPLGLLARMIPGGSGWLSLQNGLMPASLMQAGFIVHMRGFITPAFLHGFKLAHDRRLPPRRLGLLLAGVIFVSVVVSWTTIVRLGYQNGALSFGHQWYATGGSKWPVDFVAAMTGQSPTSPGHNAFWFGVGVLLAGAMMAARSRLLWFPLHPLGFLVAQSYPGHVFWFSVFLGWSAQRLLIRFGGVDAYRRATPFFLGLVLGDVTAILFWLLIDGWQGRVMHTLLPA